MLVAKVSRRSQPYLWEKLRICQLVVIIHFLLLCLQDCESFSSFSTKDHSPFSARLDATPIVLNSSPSGVSKGSTLLLPQKYSAEQLSPKMTSNCVNYGFTSKFGVNTGTHQASLTRISKIVSLKSNLEIVVTSQASQSVETTPHTKNRNVESTKSNDALYPQPKQFSNASSTVTVLNKFMMVTSCLQYGVFGVPSKSDESGASRASLTPSHHVSCLVDHFVESTSIVKFSTKKLIYTSSFFGVSEKVTFSSGTSSYSSSDLSSHEKIIPSDSSISHFTSYYPHVHRSMSTRGSKIHHSYDLSLEKGRGKSTFLSQENRFTANGSRYSSGTHTTQGPGLLSASSQGLFLLSSHGVFSSSAQLPLKMSSTFMTFSPTSLSALTGGSTVIVQSLSTLLSSTAPKVSPSFQTSFHVRISPSFTSFILSRTLLSTVSTDALKSSGKFVSLVSRSSARVKHTSSFASVTSVQSLLTYTVPTQGKSTLACKIKNKTCLCYNCEEALINMKICCMDLIDMKNIRHGVTMNMTNITVSGFYQKLKAVSSIIAEEIWKSCQENSSLCVSSERTEDISGKRRRRSLQEVTLRNNPIFERIRTKREALRLSKNSAEINISHVDVIIYSISSKLGDPTNVETTFFVTMTSLNDGANQTMAVDGKGLLQILRNKRRTLEDRLNISIDSFAASKKSTGSPTTVVNNSESMPHPSAGSANVQTPPSSREVFPTTAVADKSVDAENQGLPQGTMILIVCAGGAGLILLLIVLVFVITRFVKQRKGEFLPDKIYNDCHDKENGDASMEDVQSLPSIIDPSTPRITDVPHKPTRAQSTGGGGGSRGAKKPKKPMGVQVTYKPPEWD